MDLYEYQARQMFKEHGVPVLDYRLASTPEEAREGARELLADGASLLVVKAQVKTGGRGKAGGVKLATPPTRPTRRPRRSSASTSRATLSRRS